MPSILIRMNERLGSICGMSEIRFILRTITLIVIISSSSSYADQIYFHIETAENAKVETYHGPSIEFSDSFYKDYLMKFVGIDRLEFENEFCNLTEEGQKFLLELSEKDKAGTLKVDIDKPNPFEGSLSENEFQVLSEVSMLAFRKMKDADDDSNYLLNVEYRKRRNIIALDKAITLVEKKGLSGSIWDEIRLLLKSLTLVEPSHSKYFRDWQEELIFRVNILFTR